MVTPRVANGADDRHHVADLRRIEAGQHLVEQQQLRPRRQRAGELEPLASRDRQRRGRLVELRRRDRPRARPRRRPRAPSARCRRDRCAPTAMFSRTVRPANGCTIWKVRAMPRRASRCGGIAGDVGAVVEDAAASGCRKPAMIAEQRGLAGAVRADQGGDASGLDVERDARRPRASPPKRLEILFDPQAAAQPWLRSPRSAAARRTQAPVARQQPGDAARREARPRRSGRRRRSRDRGRARRR